MKLMHIFLVVSRQSFKCMGKLLARIEWENVHYFRTAVSLPKSLILIAFLSKNSIEQGITTIRLVLKERTVVPAGSEMELMVKIAGPVTNGTWVVGNKTSTHQGVMVAKAVVSPSSNEVPVRTCILNPREEMVVLKKGTQIASMPWNSWSRIQL